MSFAKNMNTHLSNKYSQKFLDSAKKSTTHAIKTATHATKLKTIQNTHAIQKTTEPTGDLIGNKIAYQKKTSLNNSKAGEN